MGCQTGLSLLMLPKRMPSTRPGYQFIQTVKLNSIEDLATMTDAPATREMTPVPPLPPRPRNLTTPIARRLAADGPKRILALDGGGTRGIVTLTFLEEIEKALRTKLKQPDLVLADYFDLIGGTSVGAMIATLLALGKDVAYVRTKFESWAPRVFEPTALGWLSPRYDARRLRGVVQSEVYDWPMRSDKLKTGLCIVSKRLDTGSVWAVTNNPGHPYFEGRPAQGNNPKRIGNGDFKLLDLIRASTAAPSYFSPTHISIFEGPDHGLFVDGGVSPHNNPALKMLMFAGISGYNLGGADLIAKEPPRPWPLGADKLLIVSVGTGTYDFKVTESKSAALDAVHALQGVISDAQDLVLTLLQWISDSKMPWHIDRAMKNLGTDLLGHHDGLKQPLISFQRYDVRLEKDWLAENLGRTVTDAQLADLRNFTNTKAFKPLAELGTAAAKKQVRADHFPDAFDQIWSSPAASATLGGTPMRIGFSGHRPNRLQIAETRIAEVLRTLLGPLSQQARAADSGTPLVALSALAEGSDRLFADVAVSLGLSLHVLLPFKSADYETTFGDPATTPAYRELLARAASVTDLPGSLAHTSAAYDAVGRTTVDRSDIFLTVWDGKPAAGQGGTTEIIQYALSIGCPVIWIDAATERSPMRLRAIQPKIDALPLTDADIAALAMPATSTRKP